MIMKYSLFIVAAALTVVSAAIIPRDDSSTLSACGKTFENIVSSTTPGFNCLAPAQLKDVLALGNKNATVAVIKNTVDTWLTAFCGVGTCTADTISQLSTSVNSTCGFTFNGTEFDLLRQAVCLKDTTANTFCTSEGFTEDSTVTNPSDAGTGATGALIAVLLASSDGASPCNECTKAQYQARVKLGSTDFTGLTQRCGANFTATLNSTVVGVSQAAVSGDFKSSGAGVISPIAPLILLVISGFFSLL